MCRCTYSLYVLRIKIEMKMDWSFSSPIECTPEGNFDTLWAHLPGRIVYRLQLYLLSSQFSFDQKQTIWASPKWTISDMPRADNQNSNLVRQIWRMWVILARCCRLWVGWAGGRLAIWFSLPSGQAYITNVDKISQSSDDNGDGGDVYDSDSDNICIYALAKWQELFSFQLAAFSHLGIIFLAFPPSFDCGNRWLWKVITDWYDAGDIDCMKDTLQIEKKVY